MTAPVNRPTAPAGVPIHPIESESYRILRSRVDLSHLPAPERAVVERIVHASADLELADTVVCAPGAAEAGIAALAAGAPVICDVEMVRHGIVAVPASCALSEVPAPFTPPADEPDLTRTAAAMRRVAERHPDGAVVVVGCAPTALFEVIRLAATGRFRPALVIGLPVGFVGAAESKAALRQSGLPAISNIGEKGGSAMAAAACNALARLAFADRPVGSPSTPHPDDVAPRPPDQEGSTHA